jgi:colicin import membrane protein
LRAWEKHSSRKTKGAKKQVDEIWKPKAEDHSKEKVVDHDLESTKSETAAIEHIADLKAKLAELERKAANDQLDTQEKINALIAQRAQLLEEASGEKDEEKKLNLQIEAERVNQEIISAQKAAEKELESAQDRLDKAQRDRAYDALKTDDERRGFLLDEIKKLDAAITAEKDPAQKVKLKTDREDDLKKLQDLEPKAPTIAANSLRRIGGQQTGGFSVSGIDDKLLREQTKHGKLLEEIAKNTAGKSSELIMQ